jgi:PhoPQ-activated pathogenicity-related protein
VRRMERINKANRLCCVMLCYFMLSCYVMLCLLRYVMLCHVMSRCYVMLCYVVLCYAPRPMYVISFSSHHVIILKILKSKKESVLCEYIYKKCTYL